MKRVLGLSIVIISIGFIEIASAKKNEALLAEFHKVCAARLKRLESDKKNYCDCMRQQLEKLEDPSLKKIIDVYSEKITFEALSIESQPLSNFEHSSAETCVELEGKPKESQKKEK